MPGDIGDISKSGKTIEASEGPCKRGKDYDML